MAFFDTLLSAGTNLLGGFLNRGSQEKANEANARQAAQNIELQREFAQNGIQWKVNDAKAAGIHPLYALGASTQSFAPVSVGAQPESGLAQGVSAMGQDISRAVQASASPSTRTSMISDAAQKLSLDNMSLQNQLLASKIAVIKQGQTTSIPTDGTNYAVPGQAQSGAIKPKPLEVAPAAPGTPHAEGGAITDIGHAQTGTGFAPYPSKDLKERIEDVMPYEWEHFYRNRILPSFGYRLRAPYPSTPDTQWWWNTTMQEYQLLPLGKRPTMGHRVPEPNKYIERR